MDPTRTHQVRTAARSDVGRVRSANQDTCGEFENTQGYRLLVLADGMGGHAGGETASQLALETIGGVFQRGFDDPLAMLERAFQAANQTIHQTGSANPALHGMGTTGVAVLIGPNEAAWVAHIGDSRAYRWRAGQFEPLTEDHSWIGEALRAGRITAEETKTHSMRNVLMRSIGVAPEIEATISPLDLRVGDRFLLCSDGLWGEVNDPSIAEILSQQTPENAVQQLVDLANAHGGSDNVTVQVAEILDADREPHPGSPSDRPAATTPTSTPTELAFNAADQPHPLGPRSGVDPDWRKATVVAGITLAVCALFWRACA